MWVQVPPSLQISWRSGGTVDTGDLKSPAPKGACEFESHLRYHTKLIKIMPKRKHVKKNKVVPCADANTHARERIDLLKHREEIIRKKYEQIKKQLEEQRLKKQTINATTAKGEEI